MCGSTVDIHSATAEIRRGKKKKERKKEDRKKQGKNIMAAIIKWLTADEATQSSCVHVELFNNAFATALLPERRAVP